LEGTPSAQLSATPRVGGASGEQAAGRLPIDQIDTHTSAITHNHRITRSL